MLIKTVSTVVTTDSTGKPIDSIPVRNAVAGETDAAGRPVDIIQVTEDPNGVPVRVVTGKAAQNSAGQWIDTIPVQGGGDGGVTEVLDIDGQSNAVAADANLFLPADAITDPRISMWSETGGGTGDLSKAQKVLPYSTPLLFESDNPPGVGPYVAYIQDWLLTAGPNDRLIVVCSARGGTRLHNGRWRFPDGDLSQRMINGSINAIAAMKALYPSNTIKFTTIWQQGESDIGASAPQTPTTPAEYKADVIALFNGKRAALAGVGIIDDIILAGGMTKTYMDGYATDNVGYLFEQAQVEAFTELPRAFFIGRTMVGTAGDNIHGTRADQLVNGHTYFAKRPRAVQLASAAPPTPGPITLSARNVNFKASNCPLYAIEIRQPVTTGSWVRTKLHAPLPNEIGDNLSATIPGTGDCDVRMVAISNAGESAYTNVLTYVTPSETLPTPVVDLDPELATLVGNVVSVVTNAGSYGGTLIPESSAGTGVTANVTVSNYGTNNKKVFDLLPAQSFRGSGNPMPAGSFTIFHAFFSTSPISSNNWVRSQNDNAGADSTVGDIFVGYASSGSAIKAGVNSATATLLSSTALVTAGKNLAVAWVYDAVAGTLRTDLNGVTVATVSGVAARAQLTQTANRGYKVFGFGIPSNASGVRGRHMAYREYNAALTPAQVQTDMAAVATKFGGISWG